MQRIKVGEKQYEIKRTYKKYADSDDNVFIEFKDKLGYDALVKNNEFYFICNEIIEAEFTEMTVEEFKNEQLKLQTP